MKYITYNSIVAATGLFSALLLLSLGVWVPVADAQSPALQIDRGSNLSVPTCPFAAQPGRRIINFPQKKMLSTMGNCCLHESWGDGRNESFALPVTSETNSTDPYDFYAILNNPIPAGDYDVHVATWDAASYRDTQPQPRERVYVSFGVFNGHNYGTPHTVVAQSGTTEDLVDGIKSVLLQETVNTSLSLSSPVNSIRLVHPDWPEPYSASDNYERNSIYPLCVALDDVTSAPALANASIEVRNDTQGTGFTTGGITINEGDTVHIRWSNTDGLATSCTATAGPGFSTGGLTNGTDTTVTSPTAGNSTTFSVRCSNASGNGPVSSVTVTTQVGAGANTGNWTWNNPPSCPLVAGAGGRVFHFLKNQSPSPTSQNKLRGDSADWNSWVNVDHSRVPVTPDQYNNHMRLATPIDPGTYRVTVVTWEQADSFGQDPGEQSVLEFRRHRAWDDSTVLYTSGATDDILNSSVNATMVTTVVNSALQINQEVNEVRGRHAFYPGSVTGSHYMLCASIEPVTVPPPPPGPGQCIDPVSGNPISIPGGYTVDGSGYCVPPSGSAVTATLLMRNDTQNPTGPYQSYSASSPMVIEEGDQVSIQWDSTNADTCTAVSGSTYGFSTGGSTSGTDTTIDEPTAAESVITFGSYTFNVSRQFSVSCTNAGGGSQTVTGDLRAVPATASNEPDLEPITGVFDESTWVPDVVDYDNVTVRTNILNSGTSDVLPATPINFTIEVDYGRNGSTDETVNGTFSGGLSGGSNTGPVDAATVLQNVPPGDHSITVIVAPTTGETNTGNNTRTFDVVVPAIGASPTEPDLEPINGRFHESGWTVDTAGGNYDNVDLQVNIDNVGTIMAPAPNNLTIEVDYGRNGSTDATVNGSFGDLSGGVSTGLFTVSAGLNDVPSGNHSITVIVAPTTGETNTGNNTRTFDVVVPAIVTLNAPDLEPIAGVFYEGVWVIDTAGGNYDNVALRANIANYGDLVAPAPINFSMDVDYGRNGSWDVSGVNGVYNGVDLIIGASTGLTNALSALQNVAPGNHRIRVNANSVAGETNTGNNTRTFDVVVPAVDLTSLLNLTADPDRIRVGETTTLDWEIRDPGGNPVTVVMNCEVNGPGINTSFDVPTTTSGSDISDPLNSSSNFLLECTDAFGNDFTDSARVEVEPDFEEI